MKGENKVNTHNTGNLTKITSLTWRQTFYLLLFLFPFFFCFTCQKPNKREEPIIFIKFKLFKKRGCRLGAEVMYCNHIVMLRIEQGELLKRKDYDIIILKILYF